MNEELPRLKNEIECAIQWNNVRLLLDDLIKNMELYAELFDKDDVLESYICGRTHSWIDVFKTYQKEIAEDPE